MELLTGNAHYKSMLLNDADADVDDNIWWQVNVTMFHEYFRALALGRLVAERYGQRVQSCGSLVTAALKYRAQKRHQASRMQQGDGVDVSSIGSFEPQDVQKHLPKPILQLMEKKPGGLQRNLEKAFEDLYSVARYPEAVRRCGGSGGRNVDGGGKRTYEIAIRPLVGYLQQRIVHQIVQDRHGDVAARVVHILIDHGYLESEAVAEHAMMPVKDAREVLHTLMRNRYVELIQMSRQASSSSSHYNPSSAIYLWGIDGDRLRRKITENVALALWNVRLRRQHEVEVGKDWIERARQRQQLPDINDENDHERDKLNYEKFCLGLERLDVAVQNLDETLLVMNDFEL